MAGSSPGQDAAARATCDAKWPLHALQHTTSNAHIHGVDGHVSAAPKDAHRAIKHEQKSGPRSDWNNILALATATVRATVASTKPYATEPSTGSLCSRTGGFVSPFAGNSMSCRGCHATLNIATRVPSSRWFCLCCRRGLRASSFPPHEQLKRLERRCRTCLEADTPGLLQALMTPFGPSIRRAHAVDHALAQIWTELQQYDRRTRSDCHHGSLFQDLRLVQLEKRQRQQRDREALSHIATTFPEYVAHERERVSLVIQKMELCCTLLHSRGVGISSRARELLASAELSNVGLEKEETDAVVRCDTCGRQPLEVPAAGGKGTARELCHCCRRVVPETAMVRIPLTVDDLICRSCRVPSTTTTDAPTPSKRIRDLTEIEGSLLRRLERIHGTEDLVHNEELRTTAMAIRELQTRRTALRKTHSTMLEQRAIAVSLSRELYTEAMDLDGELVTALTHQVRILLETIASMRLPLAGALVDFARKLYEDEAKVHADLQELLDQQPRDDARESCRRCKATLAVPKPSMSCAVSCDCCRRVLPTTSLARVPVTSMCSRGVLVCCHCRERHSLSGGNRLGGWLAGQASEWIKSLEVATSHLARLASSDRSRDHSAVIVGLEIQQQLTNEKRRRDDVYSAQQREIGRGNTAIATSRRMYSDRVAVDCCYLEALTKLASVAMKSCDLQRIPIPERWRRVAVRTIMESSQARARRAQSCGNQRPNPMERLQRAAPYPFYPSTRNATVAPRASSRLGNGGLRTRQQLTRQNFNQH